MSVYECMWKKPLKKEKEVYNENIDSMENQFQKSFECNTIGFIQLEEKEWLGKNTWLISKKLQESLNKTEQATVSVQGPCSRICCL